MDTSSKVIIFVLFWGILLAIVLSSNHDWNPNANTFDDPREYSDPYLWGN